MNELLDNWDEFWEEWKAQPEHQVDLNAEHTKKGTVKPDFFDFMQWCSEKRKDSMEKYRKMVLDSGEK